MEGIMFRLALFILVTSQFAFAGALENVRERVEGSSNPVIIFDLDDTLTDSRERMLRVFHSLGPEFEKLHYRDLQYEPGDTLKHIGYTDAAMIEKISNAWYERFFSNAYVAGDRALPGAVQYVQAVYDEGATIVYLTGRDAPRMKEGTLKSLKLNRFPLGKRTILRMKPDKSLSDAQFKKSEIEWIGNQGDVVAVFENEPTNINLLVDGFPKSQPIFVDTIHSPKPVEPYPTIPWILDFRLDLRE